MPDEDRIGHLERPADLQHVGGVALEAAVASGIVRGKIRGARAHVIEENHPVVGLKRRRHQAPHVLVATEPVGEDHGAPVQTPADLDVVATDNVHAPAV